MYLPGSGVFLSCRHFADEPLFSRSAAVLAHLRYTLEEGGEVQLSLLFVEDEDDEDDYS